jgi:gas vesicle protein
MNMKTCMGWRRKSNHNGQVIMATIAGVAGAAMGFTAGLLTAPRSGKEIREAISSRAGETLSQARKGFVERRNKALESAKEGVGDY